MKAGNGYHLNGASILNSKPEEDLEDIQSAGMRRERSVIRSDDKIN